VTVPALTVDGTRLEAAEVLTLAGEVDTFLLHRLEDELERLMSHPMPLVVSLAETTFVDSTILGALIAACREAAARGKQVLFFLPADAAHEVHRIFETARLDSILPVHASWDGIAAALRTSQAPA
jgi:anti-anti-sigma factor